MDPVHDVQATLRGVKDRVGYWGEPTATIDWCEPNYQHSFYIAEFWNTLTNLSFVVLALYGLAWSVKEGFEWRFHMQFVTVVLLGLGSAMFHGTLQVFSQQCDETPMVWTMLVWIYIVYNQEIRAAGLSDAVVVPTLVFLGVAFAVIHAIYRTVTLFQVFFGTLMVSCAFRLGFHYAKVKDPTCTRDREAYVSQWPINPQGHAWWHIFLGISNYHGPLFMQYVRLEELQKHPKIVNKGFVVDTVTIQVHEDTAKHKAL